MNDVILGILAIDIAADASAADDDYAVHGRDSDRFPPVPGALCPWCDFRGHCPQGQAVGPERSSWAALEARPIPSTAEVD